MVSERLQHIILPINDINHDNVLVFQALLCKFTASSYYDNTFEVFELHKNNQHSLINYLLYIGILVKNPNDKE